MRLAYICAIGFFSVMAAWMAYRGLTYTPFPEPDWSRSCEEIMQDEPPKASNLGRYIRCFRDDIRDLKASASSKNTRSSE